MLQHSSLSIFILKNTNKKIYAVTRLELLKKAILRNTIKGFEFN